MAKSKNRKNHSQKLAARKTTVKNQATQIAKMRTALMEKIKAEAASGAYENAKPIDEFDSNQLEL